jgi:hypothetical protein
MLLQALTQEIQIGSSPQKLLQLLMPQKCSSKPSFKKLKKLFAKIAPATPHECFFSQILTQETQKILHKIYPNNAS